jgi:hypothetical protein
MIVYFDADVVAASPSHNCGNSNPQDSPATIQRHPARQYWSQSATMNTLNLAFFSFILLIASVLSAPTSPVILINARDLLQVPAKPETNADRLARYAAES